MKAVPIKELKNSLSRYVREVVGGETVLVTDRGRVVAELRRPSAEVRPGAVDAGLEALASDGLLLLGLPQDRDAYHTTGVRVRRSSGTLLDEERGER